MSQSHHNPARPYFAYWGKARPAEDSAQHSYHLLAYHSLDVAAVGAVLLTRYPQLTRALAAPAGLSGETFLAWTVYFLALHDVGKFGQGFQAQVPAVFERLQRVPHSKAYSTRHDSFGYAVWARCLKKRFIASDPFQLGEGVADMANVLTNWMSCVTGHHGRPPGRIPNALDDEATRADIQAAEAFMDDLRFLLADAPSTAVDLDQLEAAMPVVSWWIAGVAVLCDWLGSNQDFFPYRSDPVDQLEDYWPHALQQAEQAVDQAGFLPVTLGPPRTISDLLPAGAAPSSLQRAAQAEPVSADPQMFILEELTGSGKTEAAVMLAHRIMQTGAADGLYFALPTMATANAMYARIRGFHSLLFAQPELASLVLAHGQRRLIGDFTDSVIRPRAPPAEILPETGESSATTRCAAWLADNNKKALLASVGVGTIDQALMAILHSRHQSMRLLGLFRKVLIVDEVHANDAYVHRLLCVLLRFHASAGGSAILLSATLPLRMREQLLAAFAEGRNHAALPALQENRYPLLTAWRDGAVRVRPLVAAERVRRSLPVALLHTEEDVLRKIVAAAEAGHCVCWIRNTVGDACAAFDMLSEELVDGVDLFHARFMMGDRLDIEQGVLARFGKDSGAQQRRGRVLVATQVVEQSLDIDFDIMFSDLAPVDLLIQRAGRLHRHKRDALGNRIDSDVDRRIPPCLQILAPRPVADADDEWIRRLLPGTGAVYPDHAALWRTARLVQDRGELCMPEDARYLIEGVCGDTALDAPQALQRISMNAEGQDKADSSIASYNALDFEQGYVPSPQRWYDESQSPTRLGEPTTQLCLLAWDGEALRPLYDKPSDFPWQMSQLSVRSSQLGDDMGTRDETLNRALQQVRDDHPFLKQWIELVPMRQLDDGRWAGHGWKGGQIPLLYVYSREDGFHAIKEIE